MLLVLTHDVDWSRRGPPYIHIIERLNRFSYEDKLSFFTLRTNLYDGIREIMDFENMYGIKSTFFFRPVYDDETTVELYADVISELRRNGWEVGLHANNGNNIEKILEEKKTIERIYSEPVESLRVHQLKIDPKIIPKLELIGIKFDSSLCFSKNAPSLKSSGCIILNNVVELPITIMDAYMYTYWMINPEKTFEIIIEVLHKIHNQKITIATILWHTNSVKMIGGKEYFKLIERLWSIEWLQPIKIKDLKNNLKLCRININE